MPEVLSCREVKNEWFFNMVSSSAARERVFQQPIRILSSQTSFLPNTRLATYIYN